MIYKSPGFLNIFIRIRQAGNISVIHTPVICTEIGKTWSQGKIRLRINSKLETSGYLKLHHVKSESVIAWFLEFYSAVSSHWNQLGFRGLYHKRVLLWLIQGMSGWKCRVLRPSSHRMRNQVCTQILWSCRQCCVNTPIGNNMFHFLLATFASTSVSCVNGALRVQVVSRVWVCGNILW